ncbi:MAG: hypothetical protein BRD50_03350 [Bacteroidetes bacterium SW_11_45_7]|nr:MAG: hypothetical protein BRD50_03350 [Bacteroidetes bacterium SW_11_45_7]
MFLVCVPANSNKTASKRLISQLDLCGPQRHEATKKILFNTTWFFTFSPRVFVSPDVKHREWQKVVYETNYG